MKANGVPPHTYAFDGPMALYIINGFMLPLGGLFHIVSVHKQMSSISSVESCNAVGREAIEGLRFLASLPLAGAGREKTQPFNWIHSRLFTAKPLEQPDGGGSFM